MTLRKGDRGQKVTQLQIALAERGFTLPRYGVDGIYGPETASAVMQAQIRYGFLPSGAAGFQLLTKLGVSIGNQTSREDKSTYSTGTDRVNRAAQQARPAQKPIGGGKIILGAVAVVAIGIGIKKALTE